MDGLSSAASVIAVIQLAGSILKVCGGYIQEVKDARDEILSLQQVVESLQGILQDLEKFLHNDDRKALPTSSRLVSNITGCVSELRALEARLDTRTGKRLMRKVGLRTLKWPLKRGELERIIQNLERYKSLFLLSLQVDQTSLMVNVAQTTNHIHQNLDFGKLEGVLEAGFGSFSDRDEVQCLPGTRTELLQHIMEWAMSPSQKGIFWLQGMAGTGKSTISRTVAMLLNDTNHLGASFFFKRGEGNRGNAKKFFTTIIRQLLLKIPELKPGVNRALDDDPDIVSKSPREQFKSLLLQPLLELDQLGQLPRTTVIVVDALDECEHDQDVRNIVQLMPLLQKAKAVRLRIFLTSRPEISIKLGFSEITDNEYQDLALHELPEELTAQDIYLFLKDQFAKIRQDRDISPNWPGDDIIQQLLTMSVPLFISAATVCRYIANSRWEPRSRLEELLKDQATYVSRMDKTYMPILTRLLDDQESNESEQQQLLQEFQKVVGVIILLATPLSVNTLSALLGIGAERISNRLNFFRSVLNISVNQDQPIRILHLSFRDFLVQSNSKFRVEEPKKHREIALHCLETMRSRLQKNICNLQSPGTRRADIDSQSLRHFLPPELEYSCRYWIYHLEHSIILSPPLQLILFFLQEHFLHWVEVLSLLGLASEVIGMLNLLQMITSDDQHPTLSDFLQDAKRFILKNGQIANEAPLQVYYAGLIFAPQRSIIRREFKAEFPTWISQLPKVEENWSAELKTLEGHSGWVHSTAFSPDGRLLASGSGDTAVRLWDPVTGDLQQTLEGHSGWVQSVAFSPDGRLLASGSGDNTVRLWDLVTGDLQQTLTGHSDQVHSVTFSPNSQLLVSGSGDKTIRLWDPVTGDLQQTLEGHLSWIRSVAFSPDGRLLASSSGDNTVRLWDPVTGHLQQTLEGHLDWVQSVAFSPDGRLLASGSGDNTVRLWDLVTGDLQQTLKGHLDSVRSVAFSPDSQLLVSGSDDKTVLLWDLVTGDLQQNLVEGHSGWVQSVAFSPDGGLLASGSGDNTVRLWDPVTGDLQQTLKAHSGWVQSVAFSPDGRLLASGSGDNTVRLWDPVTGDLQQTLEGHLSWVHSVAFSPDGRLLASSSEDKTVRLWDPVTGDLQQTLEGHLDWVQSVAFAPDGRLLASSSGDKTVRLWDLVTGDLQQTLNTHAAVHDLEFSRDSSYITTNLGTLVVQPSHENNVSHSTYTRRPIFIEQQQWMNIDRKNVLWLPPPFRPRCSAVNGNLLALGHASGQVTFLRFGL